eukprot:scaffold34619_cov183-Amphora_coffeaeformis.AAC.8
MRSGGEKIEVVLVVKIMVVEVLRGCFAVPVVEIRVHYEKLYTSTNPEVTARPSCRSSFPHTELGD